LPTSPTGGSAARQSCTIDRFMLKTRGVRDFRSYGPPSDTARLVRMKPLPQPTPSWTPRFHCRRHPPVAPCCGALLPPPCWCCTGASICPNVMWGRGYASPMAPQVRSTGKPLWVAQNPSTLHTARHLSAPRHQRPGARRLPGRKPAQYTAVRRFSRLRLQIVDCPRPARRISRRLRMGLPRAGNSLHPSVMASVDAGQHTRVHSLQGAARAPPRRLPKGSAS
jgi:hypothetical protein